MADASCSGSTPFKQLVDHQARDVSHHQDRLVNHPGSQHGSFRSTPQPGQAPEGFGAFMDGNAALPGMPHDAAGRLAVHAAALEPAHAPAFPQHARASPAPDVSNWAADFNRFSSQQRQPQQQQQPRAPLQNGSSMQMNHPGPQLNFQSAFAQPGAGFSPLYGPTNSGFTNPGAAAAQRPAAEAEFDQEMSRWMESHGAGGGAAVAGRGMEDVDAVMDQMARELELNEAALPVEDAAPATSTADQAHFTDLETPEIGNLSLESRQAPPAEKPPTDDIKTKSAVSEAAERLLESVQHEGGDKWKNSVFLSLMRDFRDGRKDIVDNEIRQADDEPAEGAQTAN